METAPSHAPHSRGLAAEANPVARHSRDGWARAALLVLAVVLAYLPVWRAGFVWDDRAILTTNPCIVGPLGFKQIWTTHFADTCPLTLSTLWVEHTLWGLRPAPYHVVNVLLHAAVALMLLRVLRELRVPGAFLGAALWALHPVEVASVAWVAELKNTLSGLFFLGSVFFFLRWLPVGARDGGDRGLPAQKRRAFYGLTLLCAALAMASKSSTVVLPAVLVLCAWWMEGRVRWRRVVSLGPVFLMAAAASALTLWTQQASLHSMTWAQSGSAQWVRPFSERLVGAGEAVWFYLGKLLWPHPLIAVYPRWHIDTGRWVEWLPLLGVVLAAVAVLVVSTPIVRRGPPRGRPWSFAFAYFLVTLLPVLGLFDGTDFRYSLVFDHFQYLASMAPLALAAAGAVRLAAYLMPGRPWLRYASALGVLLGLGTLTWQRSEVYRDEETFWTDTVTQNPDCWLGRCDLASALLLQGRVAEAQTQYEKALATNPDSSVAHNNLGILFLREGKTDAALAQIGRAVAIDPNYAEAHGNLGNALLANGQAELAIREYENALAINPEYTAMYFSLGNARFANGQIDEAIAQYEKALTVDPRYAEAHSNLGNAFLAKRQLPSAIREYEMALAINAGYAEAHNNLGVAFLRTGRFEEACAQFEDALRLAPEYPNVQNNLATARTLARRAHPSQ